MAARKAWVIPACYPFNVKMASKKPVKSDQVRHLLKTSRYAPADIAGIVGCSYQLVTASRRKLRLPGEHDTLARRVTSLEQECRDLRRMVAHLLQVYG